MVEPRKPRKSTGKKSVAKAGGSKKTTPRKAAKHKYYTKPLSKKEVNQIVKGESPRAANARRLEQDKAYYESQFKDRPNVKYKGTNYPIGEFESEFKDNKRIGYVSRDRTKHISEREFNEINDNPLALPHYVPVHGTFKTGKKGIIGYRNSKTNEIVTPYYRFQVFGKYFSSIPEDETPEDIERSRLYYASLDYWKRKNKERSEDLVTSYKMKKLMDGIEMTEQDVIADPEFQSLCDQLVSYSQEQQQFTDSYVKSINFNLEKVSEQYGEPPLEFTVKDLQNLVGSNPDYQRVLVELGRRLPDETRPVGSYGPGYMKLNIIPHWGEHAMIFEGEE